MKDLKKIDIVRNMCDESEDDVILTYLDIAENIILNYAYPNAMSEQEMLWIPKYDMLQCRIAVYLLNKRGAEGEVSHSENGTTRTYESSDIPKSMLWEITPFARTH